MIGSLGAQLDAQIPDEKHKSESSCRVDEFDLEFQHVSALQFTKQLSNLQAIPQKFPQDQVSFAGASSSASAAATEIENTAYADHLLCQLGKGAESCAGLQAAAAAVVVESSGHCSYLTKRLALIGSAGTHAKNCERALFRLLNLPIVAW